MYHIPRLRLVTSQRHPSRSPSLVSYRPLAKQVCAFAKVFFFLASSLRPGRGHYQDVSDLAFSTRPRKDLNQLRRSVTRLTTLYEHEIVNDRVDTVWCPINEVVDCYECTPSKFKRRYGKTKSKSKCA